MARAFLLVLAVLGAVTPELGAASGGELRAYMVEIRPQIRAYRVAAARLDGLVAVAPMTNVDPLVEDLDHVAARFDSLRRRWLTIAPPAALGLRHRGMARVFQLFADATRIEAGAVFTRHLEEIQAAGPKVEARLRSAAYLQRRWAAALRGALSRAKLPVPRWLAQMAST